MNTLTKIAGAFAIPLALGGCGQVDSPNDIRKLSCFTKDQILPRELTELEKATRGNVIKICGGKVIVSDVDGRSPHDQTVKFSIIQTAEGNVYSVKKDIQKLLIPVQKAETIIPNTSESKYREKK